jgi:predicted transcriptional regulator
MMSKDLLPMVADIVSAQISQTSMTREELTEAIRLVYTTLSGLSTVVDGYVGPWVGGTALASRQPVAVPEAAPFSLLRSVP